MTPARSFGIARVVRSPLIFLLIPFAIILAVPALTPTDQLFPNQGDVGLYLDNAKAIVDGRIPYREVALEYPPLALVPMVVPYVLGLPFGEVSLDRYKWLFAGWEAVLVLVLGFALVQVARLGGVATNRRDPGWFVVARLPVLVVGAALAIAWRFDLFAAVLLSLGLWAALANRPAFSGVAVGLGALAKLYPIVAAPALAVLWLMRRDIDRLARFGAAAVLTVVICLLPFLVIAGNDAFSFLGYQTQRGLQIESIGGGLVLLDGLVRGRPVDTSAPFKALEVMGPLAGTWLAVLPVVTLVAFAVLACVGWQRARADVEAEGAVAPPTVVTLAAASVLVLLATSKVFSIQYIVWLVPFATLLPGGKFWLAAAVVALTIPIHPVLYSKLVNQEALPILVLNLRNALFLVLTLWVVADLRRVPKDTMARFATA